MENWQDSRHKHARAEYIIDSTDPLMGVIWLAFDRRWPGLEPACSLAASAVATTALEASFAHGALARMSPPTPRAGEPPAELTSQSPGGSVVLAWDDPGDNSVTHCKVRPCSETQEGACLIQGGTL